MDASQIVRRFPLVARPRPACPPLAERVREIAALARNAERDGRLAPAAAAFNKAALLASDCDLPELARALCWQHSELYLRIQPLGAQIARYGLEPLVNLARLLIRSGDGEAAYILLDSMYQAVKTRSDTVIDGRTVSFQHITGSDDDHRELYRWLWAVLLADGARALASAGRWTDAFAQLQRHKGIGKRMLDGRQVAVIAKIMAGDIGEAAPLLDETAPGEPWENAVTACLTVMSRRQAALPVDRNLDAMLDSYQQLNRTAELALFHTRLGLSVIDVADDVVQSVAHRVAADLIHQTVTSGDGYAARDVLAHPGCFTRLTGRQAQQLGHAVEACALGRGGIPAELHADLMAALDTSEGVLRRTLVATSAAT
ncbi:hypothetical protein [Streptomyces sp. GbtcB7]|uniref:hypothetical protein n=1 Tax=Streptomyces sp. GbtcB7 TaxID=2824752 RepID=UPI001C30F021|nr:hypothetical protein [Streptomyces sp. GbtcB7]